LSRSFPALRIYSMRSNPFEHVTRLARPGGNLTGVTHDRMN
jgi:hypothetical protein